MTQEQLAFKAEISRNYVSLLELDEKSPPCKRYYACVRLWG
jgi:hypothetical protein